MGNENYDIRAAHPMSIKGIFNKYVLTKIFCSWGTLISVIITMIFVVLVIVIYHSTYDYYKVLSQITETIISVLPSLFGFCIGGYALIIGLSNIDIIGKMSKQYSNKHNLSLFQLLSSVFAATLILQCFTFIVAYIVHYVLLLELHSPNEIVGNVVNIITILLLLLLSFISLSLLFYTIINVFNFGQTSHFCIQLDNMKDKNNDKIK